MMGWQGTQDSRGRLQHQVEVIAAARTRSGSRDFEQHSSDRDRQDSQSHAPTDDGSQSKGDTAGEDEVVPTKQKDKVATTGRRLGAQKHQQRGSRCHGQLPLAEVVAQRAFECVVGPRGIVSKVLDHSSEGSTDVDGILHSNTTGKGQRDKVGGLPRRYSQDRRGDAAVYRTEPLHHGEAFDFGSLESSEGVWGVDLHCCDLEYLDGFPKEGFSPWDSDHEDDEEQEDDLNSWRCVYLDASLNRLRGIDAIADQPGLLGVCCLDVSYNLIDDLDAVQELGDLQVLVASNNHLEQLDPLGEMPKAARLRYVDISNNSISVLETPPLATAFRYITTLRLASNHLEHVEEDAARSLELLERLDVSDNDLVGIDWVELLASLRFLDCSLNRLSTLHTFARALAGPQNLEEVVAEGNTVVSEPQYRTMVLSKCTKISRLDHRSVDRQSLQRRSERALKAKALADIRETAHNEYHRSVEEARARLELRKSIIKTQEQELNKAFQEYRAQKEREMAECIAYAASLRAESGESTKGALTQDVAQYFQEAVADHLCGEVPKSGHGGNSTAGPDGRSLQDILRGVVNEGRTTASAFAKGNVTKHNGSAMSSVAGSITDRNSVGDKDVDAECCSRREGTGDSTGVDALNGSSRGTRHRGRNTKVNRIGSTEGDRGGIRETGGRAEVRQESTGGGEPRAALVNHDESGRDEALLSHEGHRSSSSEETGKGAGRETKGRARPSAEAAVVSSKGGSGSFFRSVFGLRRVGRGKAKEGQRGSTEGNASGRQHMVKHDPK